jgi:hypothetical protein
MSGQPTAIISGKRYDLWMQFEDGEAVKSPDGPFNDTDAIEARYQLIELLLENQPAGVATFHDNVNWVTIRDDKLHPVTVYIWVSEATD